MGGVVSFGSLGTRRHEPVRRKRWAGSTNYPSKELADRKWGRMGSVLEKILGG